MCIRDRLSVGRSSVQLEQVLFQDGRVAARAHTVMVQVNDATHCSQALSPGLAAHFLAYQGGAAVNPSEPGARPQAARS